MARDPGDNPLKQLEAALLVTPSPGAAARVRERVRRESARASRGRWWVAAASVALLAAGAAGVAMWRHESTPPSVSVSTKTSTPGDAVAHASPIATPLRVAQSVTRTRTRAQPATTQLSVGVASRRSGEPEVLVPPDEGIAIRKVLKAIRDGRMTVPAPALRAMEDADGHLLEPTPIDIPLIKIELLPGTPVAGSGGREK